jgi:IS5 family transposase
MGEHEHRYRHRGVVDEVERGKNRTRSGVRAKVEHPFLVIKRCSAFPRRVTAGWQRTRSVLWVSGGLANLFIVRHRLLRA